MAEDYGDFRAGARPRPLGLDLPTGSGPASVRRRIEALEMLLERSVTIPGVNFRIGLDAMPVSMATLRDAVESEGIGRVVEARDDAG